MQTLYSVTALHQQPDNLLIRWDAASCAPNWDPLEPPHAWQRFGLQLIDFGRAVDLDRLPPDTSFVVRGWIMKQFTLAEINCLAPQGDSQTAYYRCPEMDVQAPWTPQQARYQKTKNSCLH